MKVGTRYNKTYGLKDYIYTFPIYNTLILLKHMLDTVSTLKGLKQDK